jgi:osmotically-inducible protein OsmY
MFQRLAVAAMVATLTVLGATGCAVTRNQETVGAYVDDSTITTKVKAKFADDPTGERDGDQRRHDEGRRAALRLREVGR